MASSVGVRETDGLLREGWNGMECETVGGREGERESKNRNGNKRDWRVKSEKIRKTRCFPLAVEQTPSLVTND